MISVPLQNSGCQLDHSENNRDVVESLHARILDDRIGNIRKCLKVDTFTCDTTSDQVLEFGLTFGIFIERFREDVAPVLHNGVYERDVVLEVIRVGKISNGD